MQIKFKKLRQEAVIPKRSTEGSAGYDLTAVHVESEKERLTCYTGLAVEIPEGYVGLIFPRSSIHKTGLALANSVGVIDSDYRGEISFVFYKEWPSFQNQYSNGDRVGQLMVLPIPDLEFVEADSLSETKRGTGGYGSTGK